MAVHYLASHLATVVSVLLTVHLLGTRRTPQSTLGWLVALIFVPFLAIPAYLFFGRRKLAAGRAAKVVPTVVDASLPPLQRLLGSLSVPPVRSGNRLTLLPSGERAYAALIDQIRAARHSIHLSFFILGDDAAGWGVIEALAERARAGVSVRMIVDAAGSASTWRRAARLLREAGGSLRVFMPLLHVPFRRVSNLRSHRKLAVFDGRVLFTGGMNLAQEYMGPTPQADRWRDFAALVEGPLAADAEVVFSSDWAFSGGRADELVIASGPIAAAGTAEVQWVASGPDSVGDPLYDGLLSALYSAQRRAVIVTPYYVPDETLQRAVVMAARRGVRTQLLVPARSNHALADYARRSMVRELRSVGAEIWAYPKGMVHAKTMVVDDRFAYVGSPNFDMRSLNLNYECAIFLYQGTEVREVEAWVDALLAECVSDRVDLRSIGLVEQVARLASPEI